MTHLRRYLSFPLTCAEIAIGSVVVYWIRITLVDPILRTMTNDAVMPWVTFGSGLLVVIGVLFLMWKADRALRCWLVETSWW